MSTEYQITLPLTDNAGADVSHAHEWLRARLLDRFGGFTETSAVGAWSHTNGRFYRDTNRIYAVTTDDTGHEDAIHTFAAQACAMARQECVYVTSRPVTVALIRP